MQIPLFDIPIQIKPPVRRPTPRQSSARNEWQTPQYIIKAVTDVLGGIDLDPCSNSNTVLSIPAKRRYEVNDNSLLLPWPGRVWLNPPFGRLIGPWINKVCDEYETGSTTSAIVLVPARTDAPWWGRLANYPFCAVKGQVTFIRWNKKTKTNPTYTVAAVYLGPQLSRFSSVFGGIGAIYIPYSQ